MLIGGIVISVMSMPVMITSVPMSVLRMGMTIMAFLIVSLVQLRR